jgi:hypothetical protein
VYFVSNSGPKGKKAEMLEGLIPPPTYKHLHFSFN